MKITEYVQHDAIGLAELIARRDVSVAEVEAVAREAVAVVNPHLNAVAGEPFDQALEADSSGPLAGVPLALKDSSPAAVGVRADYACRALDGVVARSEGEMMKRLRKAGLASILVSTGPELHMYGVSESDVWGITRNPWNLGMTPGGSSGGSAALVGSRALPIATAGDAGGSTRMPAGFCGVVGLLPTDKRISYAPAGERLYGLSRPFVLVRSMRDTALMLDLLSGPVVGDAVTIPPPERPYLLEVEADVEPLRIGVCTENPFGPIDAGAVAGAENTAATLASLGHQVEKVDPPLDPEFVLETLVDAWGCSLAAAARGAVSALGKELDPSMFQPNTWMHIEYGLGKSAADAIDVYDRFNTITRPMAEFFESIDVLVSPTNPTLGVPVGEWDGYRPFDDLHHMYRDTTATFEAFMSIWNITGQPAISLPLGHDDESGMPVGTQLIARWGDESTLMRLGGQLERAMPWADRIAPIDATMSN